MRKVWPFRYAGTTRAPRRIALVVATFVVVTATLWGGFAASGRAATHHHTKNSARTAADTTAERTNVYSGGRFMAADPNGGYWTVTWLGVITAHGAAPLFGSPALSGIRLAKPIIGMAATPDGQGYWLVASDGGVFTYGDAQFYGSTGAILLNHPIVGMAATPDGQGYWLVASDGGIFTYGDAQFYGSTGAIHLNRPIVGMAATPDGLGYWLVASDGGIFTYGDAQFYGSTGAIRLNRPIAGMAATPDGQGYWLVASDGGIFTYGDAAFYGSLSADDASVLGIMIDPSTAGYTLVQADGTASSFPSLRSASTESSPTGGYTTQPTVTSVAPGAAALADDCQPTTTPTATEDAPLTSLMSNELGPGWIGGDATYSTELPSGNEAFVFSDTLIGTAQPNGSASLQGLIHSSELVGTLSDLNTDLVGTSSAPQTLIPDTIDPGDTWQVAATYVENGTQLVFVNEFSPGDPFDTYTGRSGIAVMSIPADGMPTLSSITLVPTDPDTQWGNAVTQSNGYNYIYGNYGNVPAGVFLAMKLARVPLNQTLEIGSWQYWNGSGWVNGEPNAAPISTVNQLTGVTPQQDGVGFVSVSAAPNVYANTVQLSYACSPEGPWTEPVPVYTVPQIDEYQDEIEYIPTFHPELSSGGSLIVSYNIDTTNGLADVEQNVHQYQPQFLQLNMGAP